MRFPLWTALLACKLTRLILRLAGGGGTALPGKLALKLRPSTLAELAADVETVVITGTNGKTTTSRMLEQMFIDGERPCFANRSGANLASGITAQFAANARLSGRPKKKYAVIECDEGAIRVVAGDLRPAAIVVTNLFRDQLDRYGEVTHALESIRGGIQKAPSAVLCLNADCSMTASLAEGVPNRVLFFGVSVPLWGGEAYVAEAPRCLRCGAEYAYGYRTYGHLGDFCCPGCGYKRPEPDIAVTGITGLSEDKSEVEMSLLGKTAPVEICLPAPYNIYNAAAALTAAGAAGLDMEKAAPSLSKTRSGFGRMEKFDINGAPLRMILVKNPAGCNQALHYLKTVPEGALPVFCLNDRIADGTDVSWIWDADFEGLFAARRFDEVLVWGQRAEDMRLRLKYAGAEEASVAVAPSRRALVARILGAGRPVYVLPNYTTMLELRDALGKLCGKRRFWA